MLKHDCKFGKNKIGYKPESEGEGQVYLTKP